MQYTLHEAEANLSELIRLALAGEEVIIVDGDVPLVKLVSLTEEISQRRIGGAAEFILFMADDFDAPLDDFADYME